MRNLFRNAVLSGSVILAALLVLATDAIASSSQTVRLGHEPTADAGIWPIADDDPRIILARIQSNLERVAVGRPRWLLPEGEDRDTLEGIVDAYAAFLKNDPAAMDATLLEVSKTAMERLSDLRSGEQTSLSKASLKARAEYFRAIAVSLSAPLALQRLVAGLREVDGVLFLDAARGEDNANLEKRTIPSRSYFNNPLDDMWLRLPCRTVIGRASDFAQVASALGKRAGPLLSCPSAESDFASLEEKANEPVGFSPRPIVTHTKNQGNKPQSSIPERERAIKEMAAHPDISGRISEKLSQRNPAERVDSALFIYAFRPKSQENDAEINHILSPLILNANKNSCFAFVERAGDSGDGTYDGSENSLMDILRRLSVCGEAGISPGDPSPYVIPCAVLMARPALLDAVQSLYSAGGDDSLPESGCAEGGVHVNGFPERRVDRFIGSARGADGNFVANFQGSMVRGLIKKQKSIFQALIVNPRVFLIHSRSDPDYAYYVGHPRSNLDYPYQVWGMTGIIAHRTAEHIKSAYLAARDALTEYNIRRGLSRGDAARAAKIGLFRAVFGADCGGDLPKISIRDMVLRKAPVAAILTQLQSPHQGEAPEVLKCAQYAPLEPLVEIAVAYPAALRALLDRGQDVDDANGFGKTPLMEAAQLDELESAKLLLARHANVNDITNGELSHDARSPLMYAAAGGSLAMIKLLLDAGADRYQADSKGSRAIDYLLGYGPTHANPNLTPAEMAEAVQLLF